ncbi:hypothetical protein, partial [Pseudaeromonas pectinilytica]
PRAQQCKILVIGWGENSQQHVKGTAPRIVDTALPSPLDIIPLGNPLPEIQGHYQVAPRSACLFVCGGFLQQSR